MDLKKDFDGIFNLSNILKGAWITLIFVLSGSLLLTIMYYLALLIPKVSFFHSFIQSIGGLVLFTAFLAAYSSVYTIYSNNSADNISVFELVKKGLKKIHLLAGIIFGAFLLFMIIVLIQMVLSFLGYIPYAGLFLVSLMTIPFLIINLLCVVTVVCVVFVVPPIMVYTNNIKEIIKESLDLIKERWTVILLYIAVSTAVLLAFLLTIYLIMSYAGGITKAVQWNIAEAYPELWKVGENSLTNMVQRITPSPGPLEYKLALKIIVGGSYSVVFSIIIAGLFSIYFNVTSVFFKRIYKKE